MPGWWHAINVQVIFGQLWYVLDSLSRQRSYHFHVLRKLVWTLLADEKEELLQASGLGTVHYLTKDPTPELLLAAVSLCFIDNADALEACGASHLLVYSEPLLNHILNHSGTWKFLHTSFGLGIVLFNSLFIYLKKINIVWASIMRILHFFLYH